MLALDRLSTSESVLDALADLAAILRPDARRGCLCAIHATARTRAHGLLREVRHHLYENAMIVRALEESSPASAEVAKPLARSRRALRRLSHLLCDRLRAKDLSGAWDVSRSFLAYFLQCRALTRHSLAAAMGGLDDRAARRFADALFGRMLFDLAAEHPADPGVPSDGLHALYVRLMSHLEIPIPKSPLPRVNHEYSGRR